MYKEKIGIIGGFGAYATLDFYKKILEYFSSETERNYPHIIMDNNFTMPSRTRALLYGECYDEIVNHITESMRMMLNCNVERIILVCGTAHYFLPDVYKKIPEARERIIDIIAVLAEKLKAQKVNKVLVIAAEGALKRNLYSKRLDEYGIACVEPEERQYGEIRYYIECVKTNDMNLKMMTDFLLFLESYNIPNIVIGCTEFPVLIEYVEQNLQENTRRIWKKYRFFDPLEATLEKLYQIMT